MAQSTHWQWIPAILSLQQFEAFVLPHLQRGRRGPPVTLTPHKISNYNLQQLYMGCQWKSLPIANRRDGQPEIHFTSIYRSFRRWAREGYIDAIFTGSVQALFDRKAIFNRGMVPDINENSPGRITTKPGHKRLFSENSYEERFHTTERVFSWEDKFRCVIGRYEPISDIHYASKTLAYTMINLHHFCRS